MAQDNENVLGEVPRQVFQAFLEELAKADVSSDVVRRLETTLLGDQKITERTLRAALFPDDQQS